MNAQINVKNLARHELIGLEAEVVESKVRTQIGLKGKIVNETRNTISIDTPKGRKTIIKEFAVLRIKAGEKMFKVPGPTIVGRPEDRIKKKIRW